MRARDVAGPAYEDHAIPTLRESGARECHVLLFTGDREVLLQRVHVAGLPHATGWTSSLVTHTPPGTGHEEGAARAIREAFGVRTAPRYVGTTWVDAPGGRRFFAVCVAILEGALDDVGDRMRVPVEAVMRAAWRERHDFEPALAKACRFVDGEGH